MKKIICLILALLFVITAVACAKDSKKEKDKSDSSATSSDVSGETDSSETTGNGKYAPNVPDKTFDGDTFIVMCRARDAHWGEWGIVADDEDGSTLNDAVYYRNLAVAEKCDIDLQFNEVYDASTASRGVFYDELAANALARDYISDICIAGLIDACNLVTQGLFMNLEEIPYIDLEAAWWQQKINKSVKILNKQYFGFNDMLLNDKRDTYLMYFNKTTFDSLSLEYPYKYVYDYNWTNERFYSYVKGYGQDLNSNGICDVDDRIGYVYYLNDTFFVGSEITGAGLDDDGIPYIIDFTDKTADVYDFIFNLVNANVCDSFSVRTNGNSSALFMQTFDKNGLFMNFHMAHMMTVAQEYESVVGILPCPLYDDQQTEYFSRAGYNGATTFTILSSTPDLERAGIISEIFAAESKNYVSPAFYDTLFTTRYTSDDESKDMLDIVIKSEIIDLDQVFQWGHLIINASHSADNKVSSIASLYGKYVKAAENKLEATLDQYEGIE